MICKKYGEGITIHGTRYAVGMTVFCNSSSDYEGLYGRITEIRTGEDRETDNETPDIYCEFDVPVLPNEVRNLEKRFTELYRHPMTIEDITLDMVIMAPEMLELLNSPNVSSPSKSIWAVVEDWATDGEAFHIETLFERQIDALAYFHRQLASESREGCIPEWENADAFLLEIEDTLYECWLDDDYISNHYKISLEQELIYLGSEEASK